MGKKDVDGKLSKETGIKLKTKKRPRPEEDADPKESGQTDAPEAPRSSGKSGDKKSRRVSFAEGTAEEDGKMTGPRRSIGKKDSKKRNSISPAKKKETQKQREEEAAKERLRLSKEATESYLIQWEQQDGWKFNKARQIWIIQHLYDKVALSKSTFKIAVKYLQKLQGTARERVLTAAQAKLEEVEAEGEEEETAGEGEEGGEGGEKAHKVRRKRAKTIIKALSEE